jgi:hypothetical protein
LPTREGLEVKMKTYVKNLTLTLSAVFFLIVAGAVSADAQDRVIVAAQGNDPLGCNAVLVPSVSIDVSNKSLRLSFLKIIDESNYELVKRSLNNSTNVIVDAIPIGNTLNYNDFNNRRSHEFQK